MLSAYMCSMAASKVNFHWSKQCTIYLFFCKGGPIKLPDGIPESALPSVGAVPGRCREVDSQNSLSSLAGRTLQGSSYLLGQRFNASFVLKFEGEKREGMQMKGIHVNTC